MIIWAELVLNARPPKLCVARLANLCLPGLHRYAFMNTQVQGLDCDFFVLFPRPPCAHTSLVAMAEDDEDDWLPLASDDEVEESIDHGSMLSRWDEEPTASVGGLPHAESTDRGSMLSRWDEEPVGSVGGLPHAAQAKEAAEIAEGTPKPSRGRGGRGRGGPRTRGGRLSHLPGQAKMAPKKRRTLKRRLSEQPKPSEPVATDRMICVWGGAQRHPAVVAIAGTWMNLNEHKLWMRRACCVKGQTHWKEGFQSAISALRRECQTLIHNACNPTADLRASLDLSDDELDDVDQTDKKNSNYMPHL